MNLIDILRTDKKQRFTRELAICDRIAKCIQLDITKTDVLGRLATQRYVRIFHCVVSDPDAFEHISCDQIRMWYAMEFDL